MQVGVTLILHRLNDVHVSQVPYARSSYIFPFYVRDKASSLRYVCCGLRGITLIPYTELFSVFDKIIWLGILLLLVTTPICLKITMKEVKFIDNFISILKIYLEQGNPFLTEVIETDRLKLLTGSF